MSSSAQQRLPEQPASAAGEDKTATTRSRKEGNSYGHLIRQALHRNRYLSAILEVARSRKCERRFAAHMAESVGVATQWRRREVVRQAAYEEVLPLRSMVVASVAKKGAPSIVRIRADDLSLLAAALHPSSSQAVGEAELAAAAKVASLDPADSGAFRLYLAVLWLLNEKVITALRTSLTTSRIALHVTCRSRLQRAERSIESFGPGNACQLTHLKLVGTGDRYAFDPESRLLSVPSADSYESLPAKVFRALAILALVDKSSCVLKLDDDHRLLNERALDGLLESAAAARDAVQYGQVYRAALPSCHHRAWHFGKCADPMVGARVLEMPAPLKWATGEAGYILNRHATWRVLWGSLYYGRWLDEILYEDVALAELASKAGIRIVSTRMRYAIATTPDY
jgi:hypothetical protein